MTRLSQRTRGWESSWPCSSDKDKAIFNTFKYRNAAGCAGGSGRLTWLRSAWRSSRSPQDCLSFSPWERNPFPLSVTLISFFLSLLKAGDHGWTGTYSTSTSKWIAAPFSSATSSPRRSGTDLTADSATIQLSILRPPETRCHFISCTRPGCFQDWMDQRFSFSLLKNWNNTLDSVCKVSVCNVLNQMTD